VEGNDVEELKQLYAALKSNEQGMNFTRSAANSKTIRARAMKFIWEVVLIGDYLSFHFRNRTAESNAEKIRRCGSIVAKN